jgi:hypothetical protein
VLEELMGMKKQEKEVEAKFWLRDFQPQFLVTH